MSNFDMLLSVEMKPTNIRNALGDFVTRTPACCTAAGSCGTASCSLFCTCTWAMFGSVPGAKVRVVVDWPVPSLVDDKESKLLIRPSCVRMSALDDPVAGGCAACLDRTHRHLVVGSDDERGGLAARVMGYAHLRYEHDVVVGSLVDARPDEHSRQQHRLRVGEQRPDRD